MQAPSFTDIIKAYLEAQFGGDVPPIPGITIDDELSTTSENPVQNRVITAALDQKGTYSKPSGGIPKSDLAPSVQTSLGKADTAVQPSAIDSELSDTSENPVQNKVINAALQSKGTYSKPSGGIPKSDLAPGVQTSLGKADTAVQPNAIADMATQTYVQQQIAAIPEEPVLEEICTIVGDGTRPFITTDKNGEPFALKKMVVKAEITDGLSAAGNFSFHGMDGTTGTPTSLCSLYFSWSASATNRFKAEGVLWQENGFWRQTSYGFSNNGYGAINGTYAYDFALSTADYPVIKALDAGSPVPVGITIKVYGVRA